MVHAIGGVRCVVGTTIVLMEVWRGWRGWRSKKRSLATALAITCIVAGIPVGVAATAYAEAPASTLKQVLETGLIVLMFAAGIFGATGLVQDREMKKSVKLTEREPRG